MKTNQKFRFIRQVHGKETEEFIGVNTAIVLLCLWSEGELELTWDEWDQLIGWLHEAIDSFYDNRWRFHGPGVRKPRNFEE